MIHYEIHEICICGGGSLGLVCAAVFLEKGYKVNLLTGHPSNWSKSISATDQNGKLLKGTLNIISNNPSYVIPKSDFVFLTVPGFLIEKTLKEIKPYLKARTVIGSVVSSTGFFFLAHKILNPNQCIFGFQRVPFIARQREYGKSGELLGYKPMLHVCVENCKFSNDLLRILEKLFNTPIKLLNNFYEASLTNSNPILHTGRLYAMWHNYAGEIYSSQSLFYSDWNDEASELLLKMDEEFQSLLKVLGVREGSIPTLLDYYEVSNASELTKKIKSIPAFKSIKSPMQKIESGWIPDFKSRYFTEDFPYGLMYIKKLAEKCNVPTPNIDKVYNWGISQIK